MTVSPCTNDDAFGPTVSGCRDDFDFTIVFQQSILSILPSACFITLALLHLVFQWRQRHQTGNITLRNTKVVLLTVYAALQTARLALSAQQIAGQHGFYPLSSVAAALTFVASLLAIVLSYSDHVRCRKPSLLLEAYLCLTLLFDIIQTRTAWRSQLTTIAPLYTTATVVKAINLVLEAVPKSEFTGYDALPSPEETSGLFGRSTYFWINKLFYHGYRSPLRKEDLYPLDTSMTATVLHANLQLTTETKEDAKNSMAPEPLRNVWWTLLGPFLLPVVPRLVLVALKLSQPLFIHTMLDYLALSKEARDKKYGYSLIGAAFFIYTGIALSSGIYQSYNQRFVYKLRATLHTTIFRKTTQVNATAGSDTAAITLMSTDLDRVVRGGQVIHELWAILAQVAIGCYLLQGQLGVAFISPLVVIAVCSVLMVAVSRPVDKRMGTWMEQIEKRVSLTASAVGNMKAFKISGLAGVVGSLIQNMRAVEITVGKRFRWLVIFAIALGAVPSAFSPVITFAASTKTLNVATIFTSYSYIYLITAPFTIIFNSVLPVISAFTCMGRIQKFLVSKPRVDFRSWERGSTESEKGTGEGESALAFQIENGSFGWSEDQMILRNISCEIPLNALTMVVGPVASGKSTLCKVLLGEVPIHSGKTSVFLPSGSTIGYCSQEPFLFNTSLKSNIVGRSIFNQQKLEEVISATMLTADIDALDNGIDTVVGSGGTTLSGGQRQRVAVARALYSGCKAIVFDDVLSGLDANTNSKLFQRVFGPTGFTKTHGITALLCSHSTGHLPSADHVIVLTKDEAVSLQEGSLKQLEVSSDYIAKLDLESRGISNHEAGPSVTSDQATVHNASSSRKMTSKNEEDEVDSSVSSGGDWGVYKHWFRNVHPLSTIGLVFWAVIHGFSSNFGVIWLNYWSQDTYSRSHVFYVGIYGLIQAMFIISWVASSVEIFISMTTFAGNSLHKAALNTILTAPLKYLTTTEIGVITNHFSQDMTLVDGELLYAFFFFALNVTEAFGMAVVIAIATPYLAIGYIILFAVLYFVQRFYLRTSKRMRLLDLEAKSPLYTHFLETIKGITTVRAFGWVDQDIAENDRLLDNSLQPAYLLAMIQQWLRTVMQLVVAGLAVVLVSLATQLDPNVGLAGTSLVTLLAFGGSLSELVQGYTELETSIGAVGRLKRFSDSVAPEDQSGETLEPPDVWPDTGAIELKGVSASYDFDPAAIATGHNLSSSASLVIRDLSLRVPYGQKLAICGRTGSGKSTLLMLLLHLMNPASGTDDTIVVDNVPLCRVKRELLRERIIALSQDPALLPDGYSIKLNLDPGGQASEADCISALNAVGLEKFVSDRGGLESTMSSDDLSMGERQLFCLGRAILRKRVKAAKAATTTGKIGGILLLDEISSSVDRDTEKRIQDIIATEFADYTVIAVSHRIQTVMDYFDRAIVLKRGTLVESGAPKDLAKTPGSLFSDLCKNDGVAIDAV
ncbi:hypothetical protein VHEMI08049 [[Torrubiella] hemipterigena]|uniref:ABC transporter n=1 Tax=[Torrubiella] hemipterigena TaxID=1531966 RepID=A0A0A1TC88_9HYPO|nr:hypothetical protein VHEMI08049 [[Torrubiella] hemipterigena]